MVNKRGLGSTKVKNLRLAIPSDGELYEGALRFLNDCGLVVDRPNARRYTARLVVAPEVEVLFQRAADITNKVEEGSADLGIVGLDRYQESLLEDGDTIVVFDDLGFGKCEVVVAVPDGWLDVTSVADLADLSVEFHERGHDLRVATKFPRLVQHFFHSRGVNYIDLVSSSGTLEAAPTMGYADIIADVTSSGVTLRENHLKPLVDGSVMASQACLVGNRRSLQKQAVLLQQAKGLLERIEAHLSARDYYTLTASVRDTNSDSSEMEISGRYVSNGEEWRTISTTVPKDQLLVGVEQLREMGDMKIVVSKPSYVFSKKCMAYLRLIANTGKK